MTTSSHRRSFLQSASAGLGGLAFLNALPSVAAGDAKVDPNHVRFNAGLDSLVKLVEETPREKLLEEVAARVKKGTPYRDVLAALQLAGVRNIQPRPNVGFKFHAVMVVNSAHQASLAGPDRDRWLPIFWALDNFKSAQAQNVKESGWRMNPVEQSRVPSARTVREEFTAAMTAWDEGKADLAAAGLARHATANEAFDLFARFGCRDFRDIGHKAIFVANAFRTLQVIGWHHAEPVLRSLAFALLKHDAKGRPDGELPADKVGIRNAELVRKLGPSWRDGTAQPDAVPDLLAAIRGSSESEVSERVVALINGGLSPRSVWDAVFLGGGELLMRQPGIVGLHTLTTANALHYAFITTGDEETRKLLLLQAAAFLPMFRKSMTERGKVADVKVESLEAADADRDGGVEAIFATLSTDKAKAARMALGYANRNEGGAQELIDAGRSLVFLKGTDAHDYKFSSAVMEDYSHLAPRWRNRFLAASLFWLKGSAAADSKLVARTRQALA
ncbi:hypothetical protein [Limnoglobus roseus]|uniref:Uncharacterized protein n=1 Tax=Limnoglobus roseus TaxID=2598579 RepID=A0A5C1AJM4_9BACT|nr:hypothetical protein [Limnoglobus roseus]QEL17902.1 hypothetical protein PX52LOC_04914 [Limnoglobus roseus]